MRSCSFELALRFPREEKRARSLLHWEGGYTHLVHRPLNSSETRRERFKRIKPVFTTGSVACACVFGRIKKGHSAWRGYFIGKCPPRGYSTVSVVYTSLF